MKGDMLKIWYKGDNACLLWRGFIAETFGLGPSFMHILCMVLIAVTMFVLQCVIEVAIEDRNGGKLSKTQKWFIGVPVWMAFAVICIVVWRL